MAKDSGKHRSAPSGAAFYKVFAMPMDKSESLKDVSGNMIAHIANSRGVFNKPNVETLPLGMARPSAKEGHKWAKIMRRNLWKLSRHLVRHPDGTYGELPTDQDFPPPNGTYKKLPIPLSEIDFYQWNPWLSELRRYCRSRNLPVDVIDCVRAHCTKGTMADHKEDLMRLSNFDRDEIAPEIMYHFDEERQRAHAARTQDEKSTPTSNHRFARGECNVKVREILRKNPKMSSREIAMKLGCSHTTVAKQSAFKAVYNNLKAGRKPKACFLSKAEEGKELQQLVADQSKDQKSDKYPRKASV